MGYYTRFSGTLSITPPIPYAELRDSPWLRKNFENNSKNCGVLEIDTEQFQVDTPQGLPTSFIGTEVKMRYEDSQKAYNIDSELQQLVNAFPDHKFTGYIEAEGEEAGDLWRLCVSKDKATRIKPEIKWPDMSE